MRKTKRVTVGMTDELYDLILEYSEITDTTMSNAIFTMLNEVSPILQAVVREVENFKKSIEEGANISAQKDIFEERIFLEAFKKLRINFKG